MGLDSDRHGVQTDSGSNALLALRAKKIVHKGICLIFHASNQRLFNDQKRLPVEMPLDQENYTFICKLLITCIEYSLSRNRICRTYTVIFVANGCHSIYINYT